MTGAWGSVAAGFADSAGFASAGVPAVGGGVPIIRLSELSRPMGVPERVMLAPPGARVVPPIER